MRYALGAALQMALVPLRKVEERVGIDRVCRTLLARALRTARKVRVPSEIRLPPVDEKRSAQLKLGTFFKMGITEGSR